MYNCSLPWMQYWEQLGMFTWFLGPKNKIILEILWDTQFFNLKYLWFDEISLSECYSVVAHECQTLCFFIFCFHLFIYFFLSTFCYFSLIFRALKVLILVRTNFCIIYQNSPNSRNLTPVKINYLKLYHDFIFWKENLFD